MGMRAVKLHSRVERDHTLRLQLPEDIPEGPVEVIVLVQEQEAREPAGRPLAGELDKIALHCSRLPVLDPRTADEILGYDGHAIEEEDKAGRGTASPPPRPGPL